MPKEVENTRNAVVFITHRFEPRVRRFLAQLKSGCDGGFQFFVLVQEGVEVPPDLKENVRRFKWDDLKKQARRLLGEGGVIRNCHLWALGFRDQEPAFDFYWFIEYDVYFHGDWSEFFSAFQADRSDLLGTVVTPYLGDESWHWWSYTDIPEGGLMRNEWLRAFLPIFRISARGLEAVRACVRDGWVGHSEALIPMAIRHASLGISDIGGDGPFTPPERRRRFYSALPGPGPTVLHETRRGPVLERWFWPRTDFLYHPVKPDERLSMVIWTAIRDRCIRLWK